MDSKMFYKALGAVLGVMTLMFAVVLLVNHQEGNFTTNPKKEVNSNASMIEETASSVMKTEYGTQIGTDLDAFEKDASFFHQESKADALEAGDSNYLSLVVTSIWRDLRIQVLDVSGNLVSGESFYVTVQGVGEYKDLDQDGVIYIGDLSPGEYQVSLNEIEGYRVSESALKVNVKSQVSYSVISDISLLIKTEEEIDALVEDTEENDALADADATENTQLKPKDNKTSFGIDVSKWNKEIDWQKVKAAGVEFAIIRVGYRGSKTGALVEDPYFVKNIEGAKAAGVKVGVYFFTQAINEVEAVEEASMVLCLCENYDLDYPIYIDTEGAGGNGRADSLDVAARTQVIEAFCATIANAGYEAGIYASRNWYNHRLDMTNLERYHIWLAEYRSEPLYTGKYEIWQYTSNGSIDGIEGRVDFNYSTMGMAP